MKFTLVLLAYLKALAKETNEVKQRFNLIDKMNNK